MNMIVSGMFSLAIFRSVSPVSHTDESMDEIEFTNAPQRQSLEMPQWTAKDELIHEEFTRYSAMDLAVKELCEAFIKGDD